MKVRLIMNVLNNEAALNNECVLNKKCALNNECELNNKCELTNKVLPISSYHSLYYTQQMCQHEHECQGAIYRPWWH